MAPENEDERDTERSEALYVHVAAQNTTPSSLAQFANRFGQKAAGMSRLPPAATPSFVCLSTSLYVAWARSRDIERAINETISSLSERLTHCFDEKTSFLVRSSATSEDITRRGQHLTVPAEWSTLSDAIAEVFRSFETDGAPGEMGVIIQRKVEVRLAGFLSNERRVADKTYRWRVELSLSNDPVAPQSYMISAKQAADLRLDEPLVATSGRGLRSRLSGVAKWIWKRSSKLEINRSALEWGWDGQRLWLFQWDHVQDNDDQGVNPFNSLPLVMPAVLDKEGEIFRKFPIGASTPWPKLKKLADFAAGGYIPPHRLYSAPAEKLAALLRNAQGEQAVAEELAELTGDHAVIRSDTVWGGFDLPKTDVVDGTAAAAFIASAIRDFRERAVDLRDVGFIIHQYIPSNASAWSYHKQGSKFVTVDALWGLADGMQYLDCDTFVFDRALDREISAQIRYKAKFLAECPDGSWRYRDTVARVARQRALNRRAIIDIGRKTAAIADMLEVPVQIMWFCGIPAHLDLGENLPWYRADPQVSVEERKSPTFRPLIVRSIQEITALTLEAVARRKLVLEPNVEDIRNPAFLNVVRDRCLALGIPVEMRGSVLSHAYHQLRAAGVDVYSADPTRRPTEVRQQRAYDKLVRDDVPASIRSKGESAYTYKMADSERRRVLSGKLLEEAEEFLLAPNAEAEREELADLLELILSLGEDAGTTLDELAVIAAGKRASRGGFAEGLMLASTSTRAVDSSADELFAPSEIANTHRAVTHRADVRLTGGTASVSVSSLLAQPTPYVLSLDADGTKVLFSVSLKAGRFQIEIRGTDAPRDQVLF